jgi:hypothetical protein
VFIVEHFASRLQWRAVALSKICQEIILSKLLTDRDISIILFLFRVEAWRSLASASALGAEGRRFESSRLDHLNSGDLAQGIEQLPSKQWVGGSNPSVPA